MGAFARTEVDTEPLSIGCERRDTANKARNFIEPLTEIGR